MKRMTTMMMMTWSILGVVDVLAGELVACGVVCMPALGVDTARSIRISNRVDFRLFLRPS